MINHARTLLLNVSGSPPSPGRLGDEFIPREFVAQALPPWATAYRSLLFGASPDRVYRNYVAERLLRVVHATDYEPYLYFHDKRVTYDARAASSFSTLKYGLRWNGVPLFDFHDFRDPDGAVVAVAQIGALTADPRKGRMAYEWSVNVVDGVATIIELNTRVTRVQDIWAIGKLSAPLELPETSASVRLTFREEDRAKWNGQVSLQAYVRPNTDISDVVPALRGLRQHERALFGTEAKQPYLTFAGLWTNAKTLPDQIAGFVLAFVFRMDRLWKRTD